MQKGFEYINRPYTTVIAGVDEVGRGCLCGPVIAAAVILEPHVEIIGLDDSKKLSEKKRDKIFDKICQSKAIYALGRGEVDEIDTLNIFHASLLAMKRAVEKLEVMPELALVDGNSCPSISCPKQSVVAGDGQVLEIAAASIIAKVMRDREMKILDKQYPNYGIAKHKGYCTRDHLEALKKFGVLPIHRRSFSPVKKCLAEFI